jgi:hypothetical protein
MSEALREYVRFVFNKMEGKLEAVVLRESGSVRVVPNPFSQIYLIAIGQME